MGTAGLDVKRLKGLLQREKIDCRIVDNDRSLDHCVLVLSTPRRAGVVALIEYKNQGVEPRLVGMMLQSAEPEADFGFSSFEWQNTLKLEGARSNDPQKIARWIKTEFLHERISL